MQDNFPISDLTQMGGGVCPSVVGKYWKKDRFGGGMVDRSCMWLYIPRETRLQENKAELVRTMLSEH